MENNNKFNYLLLMILPILLTINVLNKMEEKKILKVLNHYEEVDRIILVDNNDDKHEVFETDFINCKNLLKPLDILTKKNASEINKELGSKVLDVEYYIGDEKLLKSAIYSLKHKPKAEFEYFFFEFNDGYYTMVVDGNYRSINDKNLYCLSKYL